MNKRMRRKLAVMLVEIGVLLLLHVVLSRWLVARNAVAVLFSSGRNAPLWALAGTGLFIVVRLLTVFCLPGLVLYHAGTMAFDKLVPGKP